MFMKTREGGGRAQAYVRRVAGDPRTTYDPKLRNEFLQHNSPVSLCYMKGTCKNTSASIYSFVDRAHS